MIYMFFVADGHCRLFITQRIPRQMLIHGHYGVRRSLSFLFLLVKNARTRAQIMPTQSQQHEVIFVSLGLLPITYIGYSHNSYHN